MPGRRGRSVLVHGRSLAVLKKAAWIGFATIAACLDVGSYQGGGRFETLPGDAGGGELVAQEAGSDLPVETPESDAEAPAE